MVFEETEACKIVDALLRLLKRHYLMTGEPEDYIAALEKLAGVGSSQQPGLLPVANDIAVVLNDLSDIVHIEGISYDRGIILIEKETLSTIEGLALAESTRDVANSLVAHYTIDGFKKWSATPIGFNRLEEVIFSWKLTL